MMNEIGDEMIDNNTVIENEMIDLQGINPAGLGHEHTHKADIIIKPLRKHEGQVFAHVLRQFLFHAVKGWTIVGVNIKNISHKFTSVPKVYEDVHHIISNLKKVVIKADGQEEFTITLNAREPGLVTAKSFVLPENVTVVNPDQEICNITEATDFSMTCVVRQGVAYVAEDDIEGLDADMWSIGGNFSPVLRVSHEINDMVAGRHSTLEELVLRVETTGAVSPLDAVKQAATRICKALKGLCIEVEQVAIPVQPKESFDPVLNNPVSSLGLSNRIQTCLTQHNIKRVGDLVVLAPEQLRALPRFGENSLTEVVNKLRDMYGLSLEMIVSGWK